VLSGRGGTGVRAVWTWRYWGPCCLDVEVPGSVLSGRGGAGVRAVTGTRSVLDVEVGLLGSVLSGRGGAGVRAVTGTRSVLDVEVLGSVLSLAPAVLRLLRLP